MPATRHPHKIQSVHVESIDGELCVYDTAHLRVHSLNRTAAFVWQRCDGQTPSSELAAALSAEASMDDAEAVVRLTLHELAAAQLLVEPLDEAARVSRRELLRRGVAAAALPAIYSIVAPSPVAAQSALGPPTLTSVSPNGGTAGSTVAVTLTGTNFVVGATTVTVNSGGVTATNVIVSSTTSLTADIGITAGAVLGAHTVTVTTAHGTSGAQTFTVSVPTGSQTFNFTGADDTFVVPVGVASITIVATGGQGGLGLGQQNSMGGAGGLGGRTTATVSVTPGASLTVRVGGVGRNGNSVFATPGGFNGGGGSQADGGGGGDASSVRDGATPLVVVGGGGGGGAGKGLGEVGANGGAGGGLTADSGETRLGAAGPGGGGRQNVGGAGGFRGSGSSSNTNGTLGTANQGGVGGEDLGFEGGGGGGGGYFGGGGGGGGSQLGDVAAGGGGGGSSFAAPGATAVLHEQGVKASNGFVTISW